MKNTIAFIFVLGLCGCSDDVLSPESLNCSTPATVRDLSGLDGCGYVFELNDGTRLEPVMMAYCGTPPLPKEITENPLYRFEFTDGKKVLISYTVTDGVSICQVGPRVTITCISEVATDTPTTDL